MVAELKFKLDNVDTDVKRKAKAAVMKVDPGFTKFVCKGVYKAGGITEAEATFLTTCKIDSVTITPAARRLDATPRELAAQDMTVTATAKYKVSSEDKKKVDAAVADTATFKSNFKKGFTDAVEAGYTDGGILGAKADVKAVTLGDLKSEEVKTSSTKASGAAERGLGAIALAFASLFLF